MNIIDKQNYIKRYNERLKQYGYDIKTLGWGGDKKRQFLRFQIALELANFTNKEIKSVLDVGCGFGDMGGDFMKKFYPNIKYKGVDINPILIKKGKEKYPFLDIECLDILECNLNEKFDLVLENGIFNYRLEKENNIEYISKMLKKMFELSNVGVSADFMSSFVDFKHPYAFHANEYEIIKIAKKLSKRIILRNDYLNFEYMIYILKDYND